MLYAKTDNFVIEDDRQSDHIKGFYHCYVKLNSLSFGYATNTYWTFRVQYDPTWANWNFQKPTLPPHYETPRSVLGTVSTNSVETVPAPKMERGYSSKDMQQFKDKDFPNGYLKLSLDYPCPHIDTETKYVHPALDVLLSKEELEAIYGCSIGEIPPKIKAYLDAHIQWFENKSWGSLNFSARYDKFSDRWHVDNYKTDKFIKEYDFRQYTPPLPCPVSDRYPRPGKS